MTQITKLSFVSVIICFSLVVGASCVTAQATPGEEIQEADVVATVEIYEAKIVSQVKNKIKLSFDFFNGDMVQAGVKYAVRLLKTSEDPNGQLQYTNVVDEKIYSETVNFGENETIKKEIEYVAPAYLKGEYGIEIVAANSNGLTLALSIPGRVTLDGSGQFLDIDPSSCYLVVSGDEESAHYSLISGVDVSSDEILGGICEVVNRFDRDITFMPRFQNYYRSTFGEMKSDNYFKEQQMTISSGEKKIISFIIPKAEEPQAYDAKLTLVDNAHRALSNSVLFHYVLQGESATIQNLRFDKNSYKEGEVAQISFFWTPSADTFPEARGAGTKLDKAVLELAITDTLGNKCSDSLTKEINENENVVNISMPIIKDCLNPTISALLKDSQNNILDKKDFATTATSKWLMFVWALFLKFWWAIGIIAVLVIIFFILKHEKRQ